MRKDDAEILRTLIGKRVTNILVNTSEEEDYGFEIVFDDGSVLEVYDLRCLKIDKDCYKKKVTFTSPSGELIEVSNVPVGGGMGWTLTSSMEAVDD
ncbi:hypothetical protein [Geoglobus sp.]